MFYIFLALYILVAIFTLNKIVFFETTSVILERSNNTIRKTSKFYGQHPYICIYIYAGFTNLMYIYFLIQPVLAEAPLMNIHLSPLHINILCVLTVFITNILYNLHRVYRSRAYEVNTSFMIFVDVCFLTLIFQFHGFCLGCLYVWVVLAELISFFFIRNESYMNVNGNFLQFKNFFFKKNSNKIDANKHLTKHQQPTNTFYKRK